MSLLRKIHNWAFYGKWIDCKHEWMPEGFADWRCKKCEVMR